MIFALAIDDRTLMVFPDEAQAVAYCEGIDVEEGNWLFFNDNGKPLDAVFTTPNKHGSFSVMSGVYILRQSADVTMKTLLNQLDEISVVEGESPLKTIAEIRKHLTLEASGIAAKSPAVPSPVRGA